MATDRNYQHDQKCPDCKKRKVYLVTTANGARYTCDACGNSWPAYTENAGPEFKKTT